ncbi:MAG: hypothetical protein IKY14_02260 [Erysipelotrichaceae bacterium]|nr:hypothetical protein [Erysipelotrichaceae bacterium]MBR5207196.1 hypothetical protein [Erysipelotrichaceae bacterium]
MAKKKNKTVEVEEKIENYYDLKTEAVQRLLNAEKKEYPKTNKDPGRAYRSSFIDKIPSWILALFVKFWFSGAVCYFIFWGLGLYIGNMEDMIVILAIVLGMVTDLGVNNVFRFFETYKGQNTKWMMFPQKGWWTFILNIPYALVVLLGVMWFYQVLNAGLNMMNGSEGIMYVGVEPLLFGLSYMAIDVLLIFIKNTLISVIADAKNKNGK